MRRRPDLLALSLACGLAFPAFAGTVPMDCGGLVRMVEAASGYGLSAPPAGDEGGWCVLDGAVLKGAAGRPDISVKRLRLSGAEADGVPVALEIDLAGLKVTPKLGTRDVARVVTQAEAWRPWRAYAVVRLWQTLESKT